MTKWRGVGWCYDPAIFFFALIVIAAATSLVMRGKQPAYTPVLDLVRRFEGTLIGHDGFKAASHGVTFTLRYKSSVAGNHTELTTAIPEGYPLALFLSRQGPREPDESEQVGEAEAGDVRFGDLEFDDRFRVEAAPVAVVRALLDAEARRFLITLDDCRIVTRGQMLVMTLPVWASPTDAVRAVNGFTTIAARVREAFALVDPSPELTGEPFREMPVARDEAYDQAIQRAEVRKLYARHALGHVQRRMYALLFIAVIVIAIGAVLGVSLKR